MAMKTVVALPGQGIGPNNVWEYKTSGACGAQSTIPDSDSSGLFQPPGAAGIWHTGDTNPATPSGHVPRRSRQRRWRPCSPDPSRIRGC